MTVGDNNNNDDRSINNKMTLRGAANTIKHSVGLYFGVVDQPNQNSNGQNSDNPYWMQQGFWEQNQPQPSLKLQQQQRADLEMAPLPPSYASHDFTQQPLPQQQQPQSYTPTGETHTASAPTLDYYPPEMVDADGGAGPARRARGRGRGRGGYPTQESGRFDQSTDSAPTAPLTPMTPMGASSLRPMPRRGVSSFNLKDDDVSAPPPPPQYYPFFAILISLVDVAVLVWEIILNKGFEPWKVNPWFGPSASVLLQAGAKYTPYMLAGEWWRFFSPMFLHVGVFHLLMNLMTQLRIGMQLERQYGSHRIVPIYLLCGVMGNLCSAIFLPLSVQAGASGAIFGFLGVLVTDLFRNWSLLKSPVINCCSLLFTVVSSFAVGLLLPGVDNFAHLGGFIMGILGSLIFLPSLTPKRAVGKRVCLVIIVLPLTVAVFITLFAVFYRQIPTETWCPACKYVTCLQFLSWCKAGNS
ncbi:hypothetical protein SAMD00019534_107540, partial [Acytostelium subglobosum LB1]|uniref:hypothetical protein n=1 Tax=Acytostelium subglobosum LB1 TaxID=1410327 RepID=UPI000644C655